MTVGARMTHESGSSNEYRSPHTDALTATFRCDAPARWGAFADGRRVMAGDLGACAVAKR